MALKRLIVASGLTLTIVGSGCSKPVTEQVRDDANARFNYLRAQMSFDQAEQAFETGQLQKAMKHVDGAIATFPDSAEYHLLKGRIFLETHRLEASMICFEKAMELDPTLPHGHYFSGIVYQRWSDYDKAQEHYSQAYKLAPDNVQYLMASAECLIARGQYAEARQAIQPRMAYFEHNAALRQLLGQIALLENDPERAARFFQEARLLNPDDEMLLEDLARAQFAAGQYPQAHYTVKQLQSRSSEERSDLMHLEARCLAMMDRVNDARNIYLKLTQMSPADPAVWIELGNVAFEVGDMRRVALCASRIIVLAPDRFEGYLLRGLYEQHEGRLDRAEQAFSKASELAPNAVWPFLMLGDVLEEQGRYDRAAPAYGAVLRIDPSNAVAESRLSRVKQFVLSSVNERE